MKSDYKILERALSYKVYGAFIKVGKDYGTFQREALYHKALEEELSAKGISFISKPKIDILSKRTRKKIDFFVPDMIVEDKIIVEIKSVKNILESYISQLVKYLEFSKYEIGYLVNFGTLHTEIIRRIFTNDRKNH